MLRAAVDNNARWCDLVCRSHGVPTEMGAEVWAAARRAPARYPDAVTLVPGVAAATVLAHVDDGPGCSVKDSFADVDLAAVGYEELFGAEWIGREAAAERSTQLQWTRVATEEELTAWAGAAGAGGVLRPALVRHPSVLILVAREGVDLAGGAIATRTGAVVGLSNVFGDDVQRVWADLPAVVAAAIGRAPLVGYEHGDDLRAARAAGFEALGPLRVWVRPTDQADGGR